MPASAASKKLRASVAWWISGIVPLCSGFSLDRRSLALGRIAVALVVMGDICNRSRWLSEHYTDHGIVPRSLAIEKLFFPTWFSFHFVTGSIIGQVSLFVIHFLLAISLLIGYRSKLSCFLTWIFCVSLQFRNIIILHGGDTLLRLTLFYLLFLPIGECYSLDYLLYYQRKEAIQQENKANKAKTNRICNPATAALIFNLSQMYYWNYVNKNGPTWTEEYSAGFYALQMEFFLLPLGSFFFALFSKFWFQFFTRLVLWVEALVWMLFFIPVASDEFRLVAVGTFACMHFTFALSLAIGMFAWMTHASIIILLPGLFWEYIIRLLNKFRVETNSNIHYNPNCLFDQFLLFYLSHFLLFDQLIPSGSSRDNHTSQWGVSTSFGSYLEGKEAFAHLTSLSPLLYFIHSLYLSRKICSYIPQFEKQYKEEMTTKQSNQELENKQAASALRSIAYCTSLLWKLVPLACVFWTLLWCVSFSQGFSFYPPAYSLGTALHIDPTWDMFAPDLPTEDHHIILEAALVNKTKIELFKHRGMFTWQGAPLDFIPSDTYSSDIGSHRWEKLYGNVLGHVEKESLQKSYLLWVCRQWNENHPEPTSTISAITLHVGRRPYATPFNKEIPQNFKYISQIREVSCLQKQTKWQT